MTGQKHLAVLAVSVRSLRKWWDGPVAIFTEPGNTIAHQIAEAGRCQCIEFEPTNYRRNSGYVNKCRLPAMSPFEYTLQVDADTVIVGDLDEIWPDNPRQLVITQYANWTTSGSMIGGRVRSWLDVAPREAQRQLEVAYPAINTGVLSYGYQCDAARIDWLAMTMRKAGVFIADELAMQVLFPDVDDCVVLPDKWNWSPWFSEPNDDVRIQHHHGQKCTTRGAKLWIPEFLATMAENFGGIRSWAPAGDKRLGVWMEENSAAI